ncbi:MAG: DUF6056 family protein [Aestuariibacter sp.]
MTRVSYRLIFFSVVAIFCTLLFVPSFSVPFYLDDYDSIVNEAFLRSASFHELFNAYSMRIIPYISFQLHFIFGLDDVFHFHLVNFLLHMLNGGLVFWLCLLLLKAFSNNPVATNHNYIALFCAVLFLVLPLNTQAVVYVVQRITLFAAFFYLLGLVAYCKFRQQEKSHRWGWLILCILSMVCGMLSKQNVATLPLSILAIEIFVFQSISRKKSVQLIIGVTMLLLLGQLLDFVSGTHVIDKLDRFSRETDVITRWQYFTHQLPVLWTYLYKFFIPFPLLLESKVAMYTWSDWQVWAAFFGFGILIYILFKHRQQPLFVCGVVLYFVAHLVESSFLPISDTYFEHRAYLPNALLTIGIAGLVYQLLQTRQVSRKYLVILGVMSLTVMSSLTWQRLQLWNNPKELFRQNMVHVEDNSRLYGALALVYASEEKFQNADLWFQIALQVGQETKKLSAGTVISYIELLQSMDEMGKAHRIGVHLLGIIGYPKIKAQILATLALPYVLKGQCEFAEGMLTRAEKYDAYNRRLAKLKSQCGLE